MLRHETRLAPRRFVLALLALAGCSNGESHPTVVGPIGTPHDDATVFFSGHSLINLNTPSLFEQLATTQGFDVGYQSHIGNGSTMSVRLACPFNGQQADGSTPTFRSDDEIARPGVYDTLVVTERYDIVNTMAYERTTSMAKHFYDRFLVGNPQGRPFLYESWYTIDANDPQAFRDRVARERVAWDCVASRINAARTSGQPEMRVLPAGTAVSALVGEILGGRVPGMTALTDLFLDDVHLTPQGNYFIGLFLYAVILERSPVGLPSSGLTVLQGTPPTLDPATAARLQEIAAEQAVLAVNETSAHLRTVDECIPLLQSVCSATPDVTPYTCQTAIVQAFQTVTDPVPTITDSWCMH